MKQHTRKLSACALAAILGLSCAVYPVHTGKAQISKEAGAGGLPIPDKAAASPAESTGAKTTLLTRVQATSLTEAQATSLTEAQTTSSTEAQTTSSTEAHPTPPTEAQTTSHTEAHPTPPTEAQTTPPTEAQTTPPTEAQTTPPTEAQTTPPTEAQTTPPTEAQTTPPTEAQTTPPTETETSPTEAQTTPPTETMPTEAETTSPTEAETTPLTEAQTAPPAGTEAESSTEAQTTPPETEAERKLQSPAVPYANNTGGFTVTGGTYGTDYKFEDGTLYILTSKELRITTNGKPVDHKINGLVQGLTYNLIFDNLYIKSGHNFNHAELWGYVNLTLAGTNKIEGCGIGFSSGNLTITSKSTGSLSLYASASYDLWLMGFGTDNANLEVNGGALSYGDDAVILGTISTSGSGTINGKTYPKTPSPTPQINVTQTASSITVTPTNYQSEYGQVQYKWDNGSWGTNSTLSDLGANTLHTVSVRYAGQGVYTQSAEKTQKASTLPASYTISIPAASLDAGKENSKTSISVDNSKTFDLGSKGCVNVKLKKNGSVSSDAKLTLTRQNDAGNRTITSALLVNDTALGDIDKNVAAFTAKTDTPVTVSFAKPAEADIPAGTYSGTITFEVSYSEQ